MKLHPGLVLLFACLDAFVFFKAIGRIWNACLVDACFNFSFLSFFNFFCVVPFTESTGLQILIKASTLWSGVSLPHVPRNITYLDRVSFSEFCLVLRCQDFQKHTKDLDFCFQEITNLVKELWKQA